MVPRRAVLQVSTTLIMPHRLWPALLRASLQVGFGLCGSRLEARAPREELLEELNAFTVGVDRPSYGQSDPHPRRSFQSWAEDVAHLADALSIKSFYVVGVRCVPLLCECMHCYSTALQAGAAALRNGAHKTVMCTAAAAAVRTRWQQLTTCQTGCAAPCCSAPPAATVSRPPSCCHVTCPACLEPHAVEELMSPVNN
jgi:hypothetical protein